MSRFRLISLCLLAALAVGAVVLAPAGAEEPKKCGVESPTHWVFCYSSKEEIGKPVQAITGTGGTAKVVASIPTETKIECEKSSLAGDLEPEGTGGGTLTLSKCKMTKPAHCRLTEAEESQIQLDFATSLSGKLKAGDVEAAFAGTGPAEEIYVLTVDENGGECAEAGSYVVNGKQATELPSAESSLVEHEMVTRKTGSTFKIGEYNATLTTTLKVKLSSTHVGEGWYVGLGT
jgi:hypothetical protein